MERLSDDLLLLSLGWLPLRSLTQGAACVSRAWAALTSEDVLWQPRCERRWASFPHALLGRPLSLAGEPPSGTSAPGGAGAEEEADAAEEPPPPPPTATPPESAASAAAAASSPSASAASESPVASSSLSPYAPYLHLPWRTRYLLAELDLHRCFLSAQELCALTWRMRSRPGLLLLLDSAEDALWPRWGLRGEFSLHQTRQEEAEAGFFGRDMRWRCLDRCRPAEEVKEQEEEDGKGEGTADEGREDESSFSAAHAAFAAGTGAGASTAARSADSESDDPFRSWRHRFASRQAARRSLLGVDPHPQRSLQRRRRHRRALTVALRAVLPSFFAPVDSAEGRESAEAHRAVAAALGEEDHALVRLRALLPQFLPLDLPGDRAAAAATSPSSAAPPRPVGSVEAIPPDGSGVWGPSFPPLSELYAQDLRFERHVQVAHYPWLCSTRTARGGWELSNAFVVFESMPPAAAQTPGAVAAGAGGELEGEGAGGSDRSESARVVEALQERLRYFPPEREEERRFRERLRRRAEEAEARRARRVAAGGGHEGSSFSDDDDHDSDDDEPMSYRRRRMARFDSDSSGGSHSSDEEALRLHAPVHVRARRRPVGVARTMTSSSQPRSSSDDEEDERANSDVYNASLGEEPLVRTSGRFRVATPVQNDIDDGVHTDVIPMTPPSPPLPPPLRPPAHSSPSVGGYAGGLEREGGADVGYRPLPTGPEVESEGRAILRGAGSGGARVRGGRLEWEEEQE